MSFNEEATEWIFYLHKGIKFHDDVCFDGGEGREMTAKDFKYCFDRLCTSSSDNQYFGNTFKGRVVGADAYFDCNVTYPDGEIKETTFSSHYSPWQEVCLVGVEELESEKTASLSEEF